MITVEQIHISPVKSLALSHPSEVDVSLEGITGDRRLFLVDGDGRLTTQRHFGQLVQVKAEYREADGWLALHFPGGGSVEGFLTPGDPTVTRIFGRRVMGNAVPGEWDAALSEFCDSPVRLIRSQQPGQCYDEFPVSILSTASLAILERVMRELQPDSNANLDSRRFRPNFLLNGCTPHQEDDWIGEAISIGSGLQVRIVSRDPRCAITTHDPDTGETDLNTQELISGYRPAGGTAYFGVYGIVERPGKVSIGDPVTIPATVRA